MTSIYFYTNLFSFRYSTKNIGGRRQHSEEEEKKTLSHSVIFKKCGFKVYLQA